MSHPDCSPAKVASLKGVIAGGAPVPPSQVSEMRKKSKAISSGQGYGLTETMALGTVNRGADYLRNPTSCGKPVPLMMEVAIIDPVSKKQLPSGERGEVCLKGAAIMKCYNNQPEKTAEAIDENGFFHSGDIGKIDSSGFLYILDRMKDLIIRGGENIDCSEVEAALASHPAVRECSVFGLPDKRLGEVVGTAIWCTDESITEKMLSDHAANVVAKFESPRADQHLLPPRGSAQGRHGQAGQEGPARYVRRDRRGPHARCQAVGCSGGAGQQETTGINTKIDFNVLSVQYDTIYKGRKLHMHENVEPGSPATNKNSVVWSA